MMPINRDGSPLQDVNDDDADGCLCGMEHRDDETTSDLELPMVTGGVETGDEVQPGDDEDDVDGCDLDFTKTAQTTDEELPVAEGGI
jgi:hypothetical protein